MKKTLVRSKIVYEEDEYGNNLMVFVWKKTWWFFGYWQPNGCCSSSGKHMSDDHLNKITTDAVAGVLYDNFITGRK